MVYLSKKLLQLMMQEELRVHEQWFGDSSTRTRCRDPKKLRCMSDVLVMFVCSLNTWPHLVILFLHQQQIEVHAHTSHHSLRSKLPLYPINLD